MFTSQDMLKYRHNHFTHLTGIQSQCSLFLTSSNNILQHGPFAIVVSITLHSTKTSGLANESA